MSSAPAEKWARALLAAELFALDPAGCGGIVLRARAGHVREQWLARLRALLARATPVRRVPINIADDRLLGGLDLSATLASGRPVAAHGILAQTHGGVIVLPMAERITAPAAARLVAVLDAGEVTMERDGLARRQPARLGVIALDEGIDADERPPAALCDRLALHLDLDGVRDAEVGDSSQAHLALIAARQRLGTAMADAELMEALCLTAVALGVTSLRASWLALVVAKASAVLAGRERVSQADANLAAQLVLAPRATVLPASEAPPDDDAAEDPAPPRDEAPPRNPQEQDNGAMEGSPDSDRPAGEVVLDAARAAIPADLLAALAPAGSGSAAAGKSGPMGKSALRGRPFGVCRGAPRPGARLDVVETLRAAAAWQRLRRLEAGNPAPSARRQARVQVRSDDFRVKRFKQRSETTTIFVVDASGSAAVARLAEAKGAVELLLADCYVRRDRVALIAFRRHSAELLLPPTRSLVRAKRCLAALPGGGGTPIAMGIDAARALADAVVRRGGTPVVVLLTDGRANVSRSGRGERQQAEEDALGAARAARSMGLTSLLVDTSPRPQPQAARLAREMGAAYLPLPRGDARALSRAVKAPAGAGRDAA
jgi:magnesium chelatase subunit D